MGLFRYEAVDKTGRVIHGAMNARDELQVTQNLSRMGYTARTILSPAGHQAVQSPSTASNPTSAIGRQQTVASPNVSSKKYASPVSVKSCVSPSQLAAFFRQIATLVNSGIPLYQSIAEMAFTTRNRYLRKVLPAMQQALQNGQKLSGAMAAHPNVFPVHATASIWSGELSGNLDKALEEIATILERESKDTHYGWIGWGLTKATIIGCLFVLPLCDLSKILNSAMASSKEQAFRNLIQFAISVCIKASILSVIIICGFLIWGRLKQVPSIRRVLDGVLIHIPIWGRLHKYRSMARFLHVLDELYSAGINPGKAWDAASLTAMNSEIAARLRSAGSTINVERVTDKFSASGVFDLDDVGMAAAGEKAGKVSETLANLAKLYEDKVASLRISGRVMSIMLIIISQTIVIGVAAIMAAKGYRDFLDPFFNMKF